MKITVPTIVFLVIAGLELPLAGVGLATAAAADALLPLDLRQVKTGGEIGRRIELTVHRNLLALDVEKDFLAPYRTKNDRRGYTGLGKLIDSAVRFAAYTKDEKVIALKKRLVDQTIGAQSPDGYIGLGPPSARMWGIWDVHDVNYIVYGLISDYHFFGEKRSLEAARKAMDYIVQRWSAMPSDWEQQTHIANHVHVTGLERTLLALYGASGDHRYVDFCTRERALPAWDLGIVVGRRNLIEGHVYAYLARCLAQLELYRLQPNPKLLEPTRRAVHFLTAEDGMSITGGAGQWEIWTDDQDGRKALAETCATAYELRVYDSLLRLEGKSRYGDLMERIIYNTLFGAQSSDGRRIRYYTPLEGDREYFDIDAYCCPCNFRRIIAELPTLVYYQSRAGVTINLYTSSETTVDMAGGVSLKLRQETDYPTSGHVVLHLDPSQPAQFSLRLRIPRWCKKAAVAINGQPWGKPIASGEFLTLDRRWTAGDQVTLELPMTWRLALGRKRQAGRAAVMRGPVVFCLNPAQNKSLQKQDAADLGATIVLDPKSLKDASGGDVVRPGGAACQVSGWYDTMAIGIPANISLRLNEFPDPGGKLVYFRLPDLSAAARDELVGDE
jgi:DUF1680 family protein